MIKLIIEILQKKNIKIDQQNKVYNNEEQNNQIRI